MEMQVPGKGMAYQAPQSEVLVFQVESRYLTESEKEESFSGNYRLQDGGLGRYNEENLL